MGETDRPKPTGENVPYSRKVAAASLPRALDTSPVGLSCNGTVGRCIRLPSVGGDSRHGGEPVSTSMRPPQGADEKGQERKLLLCGYVTCCFTNTTPGSKSWPEDKATSHGARPANGPPRNCDVTHPPTSPSTGMPTHVWALGTHVCFST